MSGPLPDVPELSGSDAMMDIITETPLPIHGTIDL